MADPAVVSVTAAQVRPFDSIAEGTVVICMTHHEVETWHPITGAVTKWPVIDIESTPARTVVVETLPGGGHIHDIDRSKVEMRRFASDEEVRVLRPGPIAPCECGR